MEERRRCEGGGGGEVGEGEVWMCEQRAQIEDSTYVCGMQSTITMEPQ